MENYNRASSVKQSARIEKVVERELLHSENSQQLQNEICDRLNESEEEEEEFVYDETSSEEETELQQESGLELENATEETDSFAVIVDVPADSSTIHLIYLQKTQSKNCSDNWRRP